MTYTTESIQKTIDLCREEMAKCDTLSPVLRNTIELILQILMYLLVKTTPRNVSAHRVLKYFFHILSIDYHILQFCLLQCIFLKLDSNIEIRLSELNQFFSEQSKITVKAVKGASFINY